MSGDKKMTWRTGNSQHAHDGRKLVGKVRDVRQIAEAQISEGMADMVKSKRIQAWQGLSDGQFAHRFYLQIRQG